MPPRAGTYMRRAAKRPLSGWGPGLRSRDACSERVPRSSNLKKKEISPRLLRLTGHALCTSIRSMTPVRTLTERRKANLLEQGIGKNSLHASGPKPSGPVFAGFTKGGAPVQNNALGTSLILAGTATALLALTQKSAPRKTGMLSLGASAAIYGLRRFLIKHDGMTIRETGLENPNATIQHLQGMKFEFEVVVRR